MFEAKNRRAIHEKVRCRVGRAVTQPGPSPDPDERISRIRLLRRCALWQRVPLPAEVLVTWYATSRRCPWVPSAAHTDTGRLCSAGSKDHPRSPTSSLVCSPPTPFLHRPPLRFPLRWPPSWRTLLLCPQGRRHVRPPTCRASETGHRLSATPEYLRGEVRASQVARPSSSYVLWSNTPPDTVPSSPTTAEDRCCLRRNPARSASGKHTFRGRSPTARTFACLRIAATIAGTVARLATGRAGSPFAGRVSHPLDDEQHFMEDLRPPIPIDPQGLVALKFLSFEMPQTLKRFRVRKIGMLRAFNNKGVNL
jgi:hypothetical protein